MPLDANGIANNQPHAHMTRLVAISALFLASCATEPKPEPPEAPKAKAMSVHSVPTGCLVELNGEFVGITPCDVMFQQSRFSGGFCEPHLNVMTCKPLVGPPVPPDTRIWWPGQRIPSEVIFLVHGASKQPEKVADLVVRP
jgi:hypothetical protein